MKGVLILGNDTRSFLASVRSLGQYGLTIYVAECTKENILKSSYIDSVIQLGDFDNDRAKWCEKLNLFLNSNENINFILPVDDPSLLKLQYYESVFGSLKQLFVPEQEAKRITDNKELSTQLASELNIPIADTRVISSISDIYDCIVDFGFPIVVKPHESFSAVGQKSKDKVLIIENEDELEKYNNTINNYLEKNGSAIIQRYFDGVGTGIELLASNGQILTAFQHLRIHEPHKGGGSSLRKSIQLDERMYKDAEHIVKKLNYSGVMMVEFKLNQKSKEYVFIEINSRLWGSLPLAINAGINFPVYLYQLFVDEQKDFNTSYKTGLYQQNYEADFWWKVDLIKQHKYSLLLKEVIKQFFRVLTHNELIDEKYSNDNAVYNLTKQLLVRKIIDSKKQKRIKTKLNNSAKKPSNKITSNDKVLFVCYGNICRSAFASLYRNKLTNSNTSKSAGYFHTAGRNIDKDIKEIADEMNIDTSEFQSSILTLEMMNWADYVFCFDEKNYIYITSQFAHYKNKVFMIGAFDGYLNKQVIIEDPYTLNFEEKRAIIYRISKIINDYMVD